MASLAELAAFQAKLMDVFAAAQSVDEALDRLKSDREFQLFRDVIATWSPDMVGIAIAVTQKWSFRYDNDGDAS